MGIFETNWYCFQAIVLGNVGYFILTFFISVTIQKTRLVFRPSMCVLKLNGCFPHMS
jgi:hypothetical protein